MKFNKIVVAMSMLLGLGIAQAGTAYGPALESFQALAKANDNNFKGLQEADLKRLREEFTSRSQVAMSAAKSEYAALSKGKTDAQIDKLMWERAEKAGTAGMVKAHIEAMGGPAKVMQQTDKVVAEFVREVMEDSRLPAKVSLAESVVTALVMAQPAHARWGAFRRNACYAYWWATTVGEGTVHAYTSCDH